jgi:AcrR family transcriptional regulator
MARTEPDKRTRLIETATKLAYRRGFRQTSLADIAEAANAPVGNVYYYFKTKDELGEAFVEERLAEFRALRDQINRLGSPKERLLAFVDGIQRRKDQLARAGCPWAPSAPRCTRKAPLLQSIPRRSSPSRWVGLKAVPGRRP